MRKTVAPTEGAAKVVLIVDDDQDILDSLKSVIELEIPGVRAVTAASGAKALELLKSERVHLVITDYKMPGMNGLELLHAVRAVAPSAWGMLISAFPQEVLGPHERPENLSCFIPKPLDVDLLLSEAQQCLSG